MSTAALVSFSGFDVKTEYYCRSSRTSSVERRAPFDQDSAPYYQTRQAASAFQSCLCFSATLGAWCVQSASVCCSWTVLNVKYYWVPFSKMEYYFLLINHKNQFFRVTFVSVLGPEGHSLFNKVSSFLFLSSQCSHLCIPLPPVYIRIPRDTQIKGSLRPCFILEQKKLMSGNVDVLDRDRARCRSEIGSFFFTASEILIQIRKAVHAGDSSSCCTRIQMLEVELFVSLQISSID